jgi:Fe-S-cluster containining protein
VDFELLAGARFECVPGCGLCCYATPAASSTELGPLIRLDPGAPVLEAAPGFARIGARPDGGACHFLRESRCRAYSVRPFPCREFPIHVHVGSRAQASLVLTCPGVSLSVLGPDAPEFASPGLEAEREAVDREVRRVPLIRWVREGLGRERRLASRLKHAAAWTDPTELVAQLSASPPFPTDREFPVESPPSADREGLESLPLVHEPRLAKSPLAWNSADGDRWELLSIRESGGTASRYGPLDPPHRLPPVGAEGRALLGAYLRYVARRDAFLWSVYADLDDRTGRGGLAGRARESLRELGARVLARAWVLRTITEPDRAPMGSEDIERGIRACDAEALDRPTLGRVL